MDHEDVLELLELAAVEPGGLDRLMAGDTAAAAAVVGHFAGCETCVDEFGRLGRAVPLLREVVRTSPPPDLRERTLAFVRAHGESRGAMAGETVLVESAPDPVARPMTATAGTQGSPVVAAAVAPPTRYIRALPWAASLAAAIALTIAGVTFTSQRDAADRLAAQARAVAALEAVNAATIEITGGPDGERVALTSSAGGPPSGTLLFSPSTTRLVVVATDLSQPPSGHEYRCWVEVDGRRADVGRMFFAEELALWVGDTPEIRDVPPGTTFGVSLTEIGGTSLEVDPVIVGKL